MPSDFGERRAAARPASGGGAYPPPAQAEHLPCPRCESTNTKFCYYNNYNLSQPRHFCKGCRRYWTHGGTLRNIPVGGGTRKSSKRSRPSSSSATTSSASSSAVLTHPNMIASSGGALKPEMLPCNDTVSGPASFTSLLGSHASSSSAGFLALGGYGLGPSPGFDDMAQYGFGARGGFWAFPEVGNVQETGGVVHGASPPASAWHLNAVENGLVDGDCFAWPDLAISMPGQGLK